MSRVITRHPPINRFRGSPLTPSTAITPGSSAAAFVTPPYQSLKWREETQKPSPNKTRYRTSRTNKPGWQTAVEAVQRWGGNVAQTTYDMSKRGLTNKASPSKRSRRSPPRYELSDGVRLISIDSSEDNWDIPPKYPDTLVPARSMPNRVRDADELAVTIRDIFPWFANLLKSCGCGVQQQQQSRGVIRNRVGTQPTGPQMETVCLDCGNVLEHHPLPPELMRTAVGGPGYDFSRMVGCPGNFGPHASLAGNNIDKPPAFEGYPNWTVTAAAAKKRENNFVPLPNFQVGPDRCFQNLPRGGTTPQIDTDADFLLVDERGVVALPDLPAGGID